MDTIKDNWKWIVGVIVLLSVFSYLRAADSIVDGSFIYDAPVQTNMSNKGLGTVTLAPTIVNIANWTHSTIDFDNMWSGWGMPIPQQISITREDGAIKDLLHTNTWDYGFNQSYTFNQIGAQTTFEHGTKPTYGISSAGAITRPLPSNGW
jgi:hypothetical protein